MKRDETVKIQSRILLLGDKYEKYLNMKIHARKYLNHDTEDLLRGFELGKPRHIEKKYSRRGPLPTFVWRGLLSLHL